MIEDKNVIPFSLALEGRGQGEGETFYWEEL